MLRSPFRNSKPKLCCICKINPAANPMAKVCGFDCSLILANRERTKRLAKEAKLDRADTRRRKEAIKTRSDYIKEAQHAFNAFIRGRDKNQLCICCDEPLCLDAIGGGYDCGHYRSVGSAPHMRFDERNAHAQRKKCNRYGAGRAVDYRIHLIRRLGLEVVESVEADNTTRKWSIDDLKEIKAKYKAKLKALSDSH